MSEPRPPRQGPGMPPPRPGAALPPAAYRPGPGVPPARPRQDAAEAAPRQLRPAPDAAARPIRPAADARPVRIKPDPRPLRMLIGLAGLASASAITSALLPSILPATAAASTGNDAAIVAPRPSVIHVTRTVQLAPGQTAPPNAPVQVQPQGTPQVHIQVITRQSGKP